MPPRELVGYWTRLDAALLLIFLYSSSIVVVG